MNIDIDNIIIEAETDEEHCIIIHNILKKIQNHEYESAQKAADALSKELGMPVTLTE